MKSLYPLLALAALAACNQNSSPDAVNTAAADNAADNVAASAPVVLPPAIRLQKSYRCGGDNSLVYVTWFVGNETVNVRETATGDPVKLMSPSATSPWTSAVGWTLAGDDENIRVSTPGKGIRDCHL